VKQEKMKKRYIFGGIILVLVVGYLIFLSMGSSVSYYLTVSELMEQENALYDTNVRVAGKVAEPIHWNADKLELRFNVSENNLSLPIIYEGVEPGNFKAGSDILVEGKYHNDGLFRASSIITKCPSKYESKE